MYILAYILINQGLIEPNHQVKLTLYWVPSYTMCYRIYREYKNSLMRLFPPFLPCMYNTSITQGSQMT